MNGPIITGAAGKFQQIGLNAVQFLLLLVQNELVKRSENTDLARISLILQYIPLNPLFNYPSFL